MADSEANRISRREFIVSLSIPLLAAPLMSCSAQKVEPAPVRVVAGLATTILIGFTNRSARRMSPHDTPPLLLGKRVHRHLNSSFTECRAQLHGPAARPGGRGEQQQRRGRGDEDPHIPKVATLGRGYETP